MRWIYFDLNNFEGTPDDPSRVYDEGSKYYRTNFYDTSPNPLDKNSFYLSHRGRTAGANNVLRVDIVGSLLTPVSPADGACNDSHYLIEDSCVPRTANILNFTRVVGFKGEVDDRSYPGVIEARVLDGEVVMIVNHFRDLENWPKDKIEFGLWSKVLSRPGVGAVKYMQTDADYSLYGFAINDEGITLSPSYYGDSLLKFTISPDVSIETPDVIK